MSGNPVSGKNGRGRLVLFSILIFLSGLILGLLLGVYGFRYMFFRFPPSPDQIVQRTVARINEDFKLDASAKKTVEEKIALFFMDADKMITDTHGTLDKLRDERMGEMAYAFPEGEARNKWLETYRDYFPKPRRPPPPPPKGFPPPR